MNEELSSALILFIQQITTTFNSGVQFTADQLPDVIRQLLIWNGIQSLVLFILGVVLCTLSVVVPIKVYKAAALKNLIKNKEDKERAKGAYDRGESWTRYLHGTDLDRTSDRYEKIIRSSPDDVNEYLIFWMCVVSAITIFEGMSLIFPLTWLKIWLAPKVWLIEYASQLIGG